MYLIRAKKMIEIQKTAYRLYDIAQDFKNKTKCVVTHFSKNCLGRKMRLKFPILLNYYS